jgi:hypothetical protein
MIFQSRSVGISTNSKIIYLKYYLNERGYKTQEKPYDEVLIIFSQNRYCKLDFNTIIEAPFDFLIKEIEYALHNF